jgi:hypothetical protein
MRGATRPLFLRLHVLVINNQKDSLEILNYGARFYRKKQEAICDNSGEIRTGRLDVNLAGPRGVSEKYSRGYGTLIPN